jgi:rhodanese-related sulfurtransferase
MNAIILTQDISLRKYEGWEKVSRKRKTSNNTVSNFKMKRMRKARRQKQLLKWGSLGIVATIIIVVLILLIPKISGVPHISVAQAYQKFQQGAFFLDIRSQQEWDQTHITSSTLIPLDELQNRLGEIPKDVDIVVVCLSGHRSEEGVTILQKAGYWRAKCMTGGLTAWQAAGYPVESINP